MALKHGTLTLTGAEQSLLEIFGAAEPVGGPNDVACQFVSLQPGGAGGNPIFVGGPGVSATDYGTRLPAPAGGIPPAPYVLEWGGPAGLIRLSNAHVVGTANEILHVLYVWA